MPLPGYFSTYIAELGEVYFGVFISPHLVDAAAATEGTAAADALSRFFTEGMEAFVSISPFCLSTGSNATKFESPTRAISICTTLINQVMVLRHVHSICNLTLSTTITIAMRQTKVLRLYAGTRFQHNHATPSNLRIHHVSPTMGNEATTKLFSGIMKILYTLYGHYRLYHSQLTNHTTYHHHINMVNITHGTRRITRDRHGHHQNNDYTTKLYHTSYTILYTTYNIMNSVQRLPILHPLTPIRTKGDTGIRTHHRLRTILRDKQAFSSLSTTSMCTSVAKRPSDFAQGGTTRVDKRTKALHGRNIYPGVKGTIKDVNHTTMKLHNITIPAPGGTFSGTCTIRPMSKQILVHHHPGRHHSHNLLIMPIVYTVTKRIHTHRKHARATRSMRHFVIIRGILRFISGFEHFRFTHSFHIYKTYNPHHNV